jgi:hypothetical protein
MSNIHRLGDFNDNRNNNAGSRRYVSMFGPNFNQSAINPRQETFTGFVKNYCCPYFKVSSFIFIITLVDVAMYILTVCYDGIADVKKYGLLAPTFNALDTFGMAVNDFA